MNTSRGDLHHVPAETKLLVRRYYRGGYIVPRRERPRRSTQSQRNDPYTLIVALDNNNTAHGSLYVDDGSSFAFLDGAYLEAAISLEGGVLSWRVTHNVAAYLHTIERIVLLGVASGGLKVTDVASGRDIETSAWRGNPSAVMLRQPGVIISEDWDLKIAPSTA